jgi:hypothetical protein
MLSDLERVRAILGTVAEGDALRGSVNRETMAQHLSVMLNGLDPLAAADLLAAIRIGSESFAEESLDPDSPYTPTQSELGAFMALIVGYRLGFDDGRS